MTVDQLDELIRKYLSTGVALVLVLVGPAAAPSGAAARPQAATTSAHSTGAPSRPPTRDTGERAGPTATSHGSDDAAQPGRGEETDVGDPTGKPTDHSGKPRSEPGADHATAGSTARTAAATYGWGTPNREDDFTGDLSGWGVYDGPGHAGKGIRSPRAASVANGVLTIEGDAEGATAGMAWGRGEGQKYGRWEGRVKTPPSDDTYHAVMLLWPDSEKWPEDGEVDFMEMLDPNRQETNAYIHYSEDNKQEHGEVKTDATQWHNWAVEWTPEHIITYLDGREWFRVTDPKVLPPGKMHLCIQLDWFPGDDDKDVKDSSMQVDWVKEYPYPGK